MVARATGDSQSLQNEEKSNYAETTNEVKRVLDQTDQAFRTAKQWVDTYEETVSSLGDSATSVWEKLSYISKKFQTVIAPSQSQIPKFEATVPPLEWHSKGGNTSIINHLIEYSACNFNELQRFLGELGDINTRISFYVSALKISKQKGKISFQLKNSAENVKNLNMQQLEISLKKLEGFKALLEGQIQSPPSSISKEKIDELQGMLGDFETGIQETKNLKTEIKDQLNKVKKKLDPDDDASSDDSVSSDGSSSPRSTEITTGRWFGWW